MALFTGDTQAVAGFDAGRIFPGTRTSSAFVVHDASGGAAAADRSSPYAVVGDGLLATTSPWSATFGAARYVQGDFGSPLPSGVDAGGVTLDLAFASASTGATACAYVEVRRASDDAVLATYGSPAAPAACATGSTPVGFAIALPVVQSADRANDLRIRLYGRDSSGSGWVIDQATVSGSTPYAPFTLYPVRVTDAADGVPESAPWELQGP
jgi:hypothetical protein